MSVPAVLALADGTIFRGQSIGAKGNTTGEVVFNTAITGYQEILTDPSYARQIVTLTYPHIGNTGTTPEDLESPQIFAAGLIIRDLPAVWSNWRSDESLPQFLERGKVVAIAGIDTRKLTRVLREKGAQAGCIMTGEKADQAAAVKLARKFPGLKGMDLAKVVSAKRTYQWNDGTVWPDPTRAPIRSSQRLHVVAYDFGIKRNILRTARRPRLPHDGGAGADRRRGSAGARARRRVSLQRPGRPRALQLRDRGDRASSSKPTCRCSASASGTRCLGLAAGANTVKMKFGHHGANHPVQDLESGRVFITSQNHGFAVDESTLPANVKATHRSLFDGSLQGIDLHRPAGVQLPGTPGGEPRTA